jgi:hypothetical protein
MGAWYSMIPAIKHNDNKFRAWQKWMRWLSKSCLSQTAWAKKARGQAILGNFATDNTKPILITAYMK